MTKKLPSSVTFETNSGGKNLPNGRTLRRSVERRRRIEAKKLAKQKSTMNH